MNTLQESEYYLQLGSRIRDARKRAGIPQDILADQLGLSRSSIVNVEKGRHRLLIHSLAEIAEVLNVELSELLPTTPSQVKKDGKVVAASATKVISGTEIDAATEDAIAKFVSYIQK